MEGNKPIMNLFDFIEHSEIVLTAIEFSKETDGGSAFGFKNAGIGTILEC